MAVNGNGKQEMEGQGTERNSRRHDGVQWHAVAVEHTTYYISSLITNDGFASFCGDGRPCQSVLFRWS